jgi:hypothetical protein
MPEGSRLVPWGNIKTGEKNVAFSVQKKIDGKWRNCIVGDRALFDSENEAIAAIREVSDE